MKQTKAEELKVITVEDEHVFFALIEERLERQGFELLDTFSPLPQRETSAELT